MSCSSDGLKDYFLGEASAADRTAIEAHVRSCGKCADELDALSATKAALLMTPDEEPPRRIAFVSDKVFEPKWWHRFGTAGARLGFASAAMLAFAIASHGYLSRPVVTAAPATTISQAEIDEQVERRVRVAVEKAVAQVEARQAARTLELIQARHDMSDRKVEEQIRDLQDYLVRMNKRNAVLSRAVYDGGAQP